MSNGYHSNGYHDSAVASSAISPPIAPKPLPSAPSSYSHPSTTTAARSASPFSSTSSSSTVGPLIGVVRKEALVDLEPECTECHSRAVIEDHKQGILVCTNCGLQLGGQLISEENEWRDFDDDGPRSHGAQSNRVGGVEEGLYFMGLSTVIGQGAEGSTSGALARLQATSTTEFDMNKLQQAFRRIDRLAGALSLPDGVKEQAKAIYKRCVEVKLFKTKKGDTVYTACLFAACRLQGVPRTLKEIVATASADAGNGKAVTVKEVHRAAKKMKQHRLLKRDNKSAAAGGAGAADQPSSAAQQQAESALSAAAGATAASLVERYCSTLRLPRSIELAVSAVIDAAERLSVLEGRTPATLVGACIYLCAQLGEEGKYVREWEKIAMVTATSPVTLRKAYKELWAARMRVVPVGFTSAVRVEQLPPG